MEQHLHLFINWPDTASGLLFDGHNPLHLYIVTVCGWQAGFVPVMSRVSFLHLVLHARPELLLKMAAEKMVKARRMDDINVMDAIIYKKWECHENVTLNCHCFAKNAQLYKLIKKLCFVCTGYLVVRKCSLCRGPEIFALYLVQGFLQNKPELRKRPFDWIVLSRFYITECIFQKDQYTLISFSREVYFLSFISNSVVYHVHQWQTILTTNYWCTLSYFCYLRLSKVI